MTADELLAIILEAPISQQGDVYAFTRAKRHEEDAGGFDISANDDYGTYHVAEFSCGGRKDDGTYWTNAEKNRQAMIAVWNMMPKLLEERKDMLAYIEYIGLNMEQMAHGWVPVCYEEFVDSEHNGIPTEIEDIKSQKPDKPNEDEDLDDRVFVW